MTVSPSPPGRPALRSPRAGLYVTPDGRYSLARGHGRFQDVWTLHDHATGYMATHHGKRAAVAALRTALRVRASAASAPVDDQAASPPVGTASPYSSRSTSRPRG